MVSQRPTAAMFAERVAVGRTYPRRAASIDAPLKALVGVRPRLWLTGLSKVHMVVANSISAGAMANGGDETLKFAAGDLGETSGALRRGVFVNSNNLSVQSGNLLGQAETGRSPGGADAVHER